MEELSNPIAVRADAILTDAYVAGTVIGVGKRLENYNQAILFIKFTKGSLTNATIKVELSDNNSVFYEYTERVLDATQNLTINIPIKARYIKVSAIGVGTVTSSSLGIDAILSTAAFDGTQYDENGYPKISIAGAADGISLGSSSVGGGNNTYSNVSLDYTATPTAGQRVIVLSGFASAVFAAALASINFGTAVIKRRNATTGAWDTLPVTASTLVNEYATNGTCTLTLPDMVAVFAAGDTVAMTVEGVEKDYDGLNKANDHVTNHPVGLAPVNLAASGVVLAVPGRLRGMYVNSTNAGTVKIYDNASAGSGTVINNTITPAVGYHELGNASAANGVYATIAGTALDVTFYVEAN